MTVSLVQRTVEAPVRREYFNANTDSRIYSFNSDGSSSVEASSSEKHRNIISETSGTPTEKLEQFQLSASYDDSKRTFGDIPSSKVEKSKPVVTEEHSATVSSVSASDTSSEMNDDDKKAVFAGTIYGGSSLNFESYSVQSSNKHISSSGNTVLFNGKEGETLDVKAGMTVPGYDGEVVAFCTRQWEDQSWGGSLLAVRVNFAEVHADDSELGINIKASSQAWSGSTALDGKYPTMLDGTAYCPVSMAVGDFDGDGYKNEVVVVYTDDTSIYFTPLQLTTYPDGSLKIQYFGTGGGRVHTYDYEYGPNHSYNNIGYTDVYKARGQNMDGLMGSYSCCVVAGDFDGKGKDEFAVVWRDVQPQDGKFTSGSYSIKEPQWYGLDRKDSRQDLPVERKLLQHSGRRSGV